MVNKKILVVDDSAANLTACKRILKDQYDVYPAPSAEKMFDILKHVIPDLILLDVEMSVTDGFEAIRLLKRYDEYRDIPVIFLSAMDDAQNEMEGLNLGAVDYIHKPFVAALLVRRIETHIAVVEGRNELRALNRAIGELTAYPPDQAAIPAETDKEALRMLLSKGRLLSKMGRALRAPLNLTIDMIESAIKSEEIDKIKQFLGKADVETRLMLEIIDDILDISQET